VAGLAGCVGGFGFDSESDCSTGRTMHDSDVSSPQTAAWPAARYDAANTGFNPDASGPTGDVGLAWRQSACTEAGSGVVVSDGRAYAGGLVVDGATGRPRWHRSLDAPGLGTPAVADGVVYVGIPSGAVLAVDAGDGRVRWRVETREVLFGDYTRAGVSGSPAVVDGVVYVATAPGDLYAIAER